MTGYIDIIRKKTEIVDGRKEEKTATFFERRWSDVQSLSTKEKYTALQVGLENSIIFKVRNCQKMEELRLKMKEFHVEYKGAQFDVYEATPMYTNPQFMLLKCRASA
jgi:phage head-tail adaptor, putative, SPP1 family